MHIKVAGVVAGAVIALCLAQPAAAAEATTPSCLPEAPKPTWSTKFRPPKGVQRSQSKADFNEGRLGARGCQIEALRQSLASGAMDPTDNPEAVAYWEVNRRAAEIARLYHSRSGRQQWWMDTASKGVALGAAGYLLSGGAGATTQAYWGYGALAFVLVAQFNAYEPTRDLFFGGSLGVYEIAGRYKVIRDNRNNLAAIVKPPAGSARDDALKAAKATCIDLRREIPAMESWTPNRGDKVAILPEARRVLAACRDFESNFSALKILVEAPSIQDAALSAKYATDILALDANVVLRDQDLRYTPFETLTGLAAAPFDAASTLLTGDNGKKAIDGLKTQAAFANLDLDLSPISIPGVPKATAAYIALAPAVYGRLEPTVVREAGTKKEPKDPDAKTASAAVGKLDDAVAGLNGAYGEVASASKYATDLLTMAAASHLSFTYDATTRYIKVGPLAPPAEPSSTGPKTAGAPAGTPAAQP